MFNTDICVIFFLTVAQQYAKTILFNATSQNKHDTNSLAR